jgi:3-oxoacyl-[acyl-carrier protein] reductase
VNYASSKEGAERVVDEIRRSGGKAVAIQADVARESDIKRLFSETQKLLGPVDILVNNAGIYEFGAIEEVTAEHFHKQFDLNVLGLLLASREAAKSFGPSGGSIINISSVVATTTPPNASVYSATKAAVDAITKSLAKELGPRGIRVNAINPGMVETAGTQGSGIISSEWRIQYESQASLRRIGQPEDIAPGVVFLASTDAAWITGETLTVSGGY